MKNKITTLLLSLVLLAGCSDNDKELITLPECQIKAEVIWPKKGDHLYASWLYLAPGLAAVYRQPLFKEDVIEISLANPGKGTRIGLRMEEGDMVYSSRFETVAGEENNIRLRYPAIWKQKELLGCKKETIVALSWQISINGTDIGTYVKEFHCHPINECITRITTETSLLPTKAMYAGYIEEGHPELGALTHEAITLGIVPMFCEYQRGIEYVKQQLLALWCAVENRGITTHPTQSATDEKRQTQQLHSLSEVLANKGGTTEEVAMLFTSLCQQLGFYTTLHTRPNGIYIGIADKAYFPNPPLVYFLDITQLNSVPREGRTNFQEALRRGLQMYQQDQHVGAENPSGYEELWIDTIRADVPSLSLSQQ